MFDKYVGILFNKLSVIVKGFYNGQITRSFTTIALTIILIIILTMINGGM